MVPRLLFGDLNGAAVARVSVAGVDVRQAHEGQLLLSERGIPLRLSAGGRIAGSPTATGASAAQFGQAFQELPLACIGFDMSGPAGGYAQFYQPMRYVEFFGDENIPIVVFRDRIEYPNNQSILYSIFGVD